jgi:hypothetical protein
MIWSCSAYRVYGTRTRRPTRIKPQPVVKDQYDDDGNAAGADRFTDRALIQETSTGFHALYERGEDFYSFFDREIVPLAPPTVPY